MIIVAAALAKTTLATAQIHLSPVCRSHSFFSFFPFNKLKCCVCDKREHIGLSHRFNKISDRWVNSWTLFSPCYSGATRRGSAVKRVVYIRQPFGWYC